MCSYWYVGNFIWVGSEDFEGQPEYALNCHQIHAIHLLTAHFVAKNELPSFHAFSTHQI
jgi:hypothetical protein